MVQVFIGGSNFTSHRMEINHAVGNFFTMKQLIFTIFALFATVSLYAQTIIGTVYDAQTRETIPFCTIVLGSNSTNGTIANVNGDYIANNIQNIDSIAFSAVGYERKAFSAAQLMQDATVMLKPRVYQIDEVVVRPINIDTLMQNIKGKILASCPNRYPVLGGMYRKQIVEEGKLSFLGECEMYCCSKIVKGVSQERVATQNVMLTKNTAVFGRFLFPHVSNCAKFYGAYREILRQSNNWKLNEITSSEDGQSPVYVLCATDTYNQTITIHYHVNDNAILWMELVWKGDALKPFKKSITGAKLYRNPWKLYFKYSKNAHGKYVLKYSRVEMDMTLDRNKGKLINCVYIMDYLVTNDNVTGIVPDRKPNYDPFEKAKGKVVEQSELRVIPPDYEL